jgi:hypothetical protein
MVASFSFAIQNMLAILDNPSSYIEQEKKSDKQSEKESFENFISEFVSAGNVIEKKHMPLIIETLKKIMPREIKIDYSDLYDYFKKSIQFKSNPICDCYTQQINQIDKYNDNDETVKSCDLFLAFHCKNCGHFESDHKVCSKYIHTEYYMCNTCGLTKSSHIVCMNYSIISDDCVNCVNCGFTLRDHQYKCNQLKIEDCGKFIKDPKYDSKCANCIYNETHHRYSKKYHSLNDMAKSKISDMYFEITAKFISMNKTEQLKYYDDYHMITSMLIRV